MPGERTEATEIATGLGMLGFEHLDAALAARPSELVNVETPTWERLESAATGEHRVLLASAFANGAAFAACDDGLRHRRPLRIEWKGPHRPPGYDLVPADLRVDHVYLVSCKYQSKLLMNAAPGHLFERGLAVRGGEARDWYEAVAPAAYAAFYGAVRSFLGDGFTADPGALTRAEREQIGAKLARNWPPELEAAYAAFSAEVAAATALRWSDTFPALRDRELLLWRMLRLSESPYFVLGTRPGHNLRLRIATPWDWRQQFRLLDLRIWARESRQPRVEWEAAVLELASGDERRVRGHVEVRWSHGRFSGMPEAKIYLDTAHEDVPGYFPLEPGEHNSRGAANNTLFDTAPT